MNEAVLRSMIKKWRAGSVPPKNICGDDTVGNAIDEGMRIGVNACCNDLESLIDLLTPVKT